jgi:regulator of protease activity HflC (stomatin/prohibitin superfamily)
MTESSKRPEHIALVSLVLNVLFFGIAFFLGRWSGIFAISAVGWLILSVALIWFVLCIQFHQRFLAEQEKLDVSLLARDEKASTIFQAKTEQAALFSVAQRRLEIIEKWFIPIFSIVIAAYQIAVGLYLLSDLKSGIEADIKQPLLCAIFLAAMAFVGFLLSRYATGMSAQPQWKPLRAGGSSMLGAAVLSFIIAIILALVHLFDFDFLLNIISIVILGILILLGIETAINLVLDIYRPRLKGQYSRSAFDSRLLGVINEPGGILRSAADAIDYQFGFKVSQTWFYKLLEQAIVPLVLFGAVTLYLLSCIVVVGPDEEAIIEHFGNPVNDANDVRHIGPGLTFKLPWPIEIAYKYPTKRISEIGIGYVVKDEAGEKAHPRPKLWGLQHYDEEYQLLVASEQGDTDSSAETVPVSLVIAAVPVQYRIKNLYDFIYKHDEPEDLLESICYRELTKFAASAKIEVEQESDTEQSLLGTGRAEAAKTLTKRIQTAADAMELGVEIVFLGLQGVHPPPDVAPDYQNVIGAIQKKQKLILDAQAESIRALSTKVGSVEKANELHNLASRYEQARQTDNPEEIDRLGRQLDDAFEQTQGEIYKTLREAKTYAFKKETLAEATGQRFADQLKAFRAAPEIYLREQWLAMYEKALKNTRKYVVVADQNDTQVTIINLEESQTPNIYSGLDKESNEK